MTAARNLISSPRCFASSRTAASILIATPNAILRKQLCDKLRTLTVVEEARTGAEALERLHRRGARVVVLDRKFPDLHCDELIDVVERQFPGTDVVLIDGESGVIDLPQEMRGDSAFGWLEEWNMAPERGPAVARSVPSGHGTATASEAMLLPGMVGASEPMRQISRLVRAVARHSTAVLISGETGVGKEIVAEAVHKLSPRAEKPFVTVNCAAIPEALVEAELFGHTRGAFTGAVQSRLGKIHAAQSGTIFFDEIGELPLASQSKLLRFLESGEVQRLGTSDVFQLDARVIAATNVDLERRVQQGLFREDLFYRLSVFPIELPPLRERVMDIPLLARHFLERLTGTTCVQLSEATVAKLTAHRWPGNIRELRNVLERAFVLADGGMEITPEQILMRKPCGSVRVASESS
jgi:DNA-binding NtrC family response regulator